MLPTESIGCSVQEKKQKKKKKKKKDFQDGCHCGHLEFPIGTILAIFDLEVIPMLPTKFRVSTDSGVQEKKQKIEFQDGSHLRFPIGTILAIFNKQSHPNASYQVSSQLAQGCRRSRLLKLKMSPTCSLVNSFNLLANPFSFSEFP